MPITVLDKHIWYKHDVYFMNHGPSSCIKLFVKYNCKLLKILYEEMAWRQRVQTLQD